MTCFVKPGQIVQADRVCHQRVAFPMADRVPHPVVAEIFRMIPPVGPYLADLMVPFEDDKHSLRALDNLERKGSKLPVDRRTLGRALRNVRLQLISTATIRAFVAHVVIKFLLCPRLQGKRGMPKNQIISLIGLRVNRPLFLSTTSSLLTTSHARHPDSR